MKTVVRITLTEPPVGKRKQFDNHGVELAFMASLETRSASPEDAKHN